MQHDTGLLIKNSIENADRALSDAEQNLTISLYVVQNRTYYAIFYIVLALAYLDGFSTGKHQQLKGWFNREYIYKNKIFIKFYLPIGKNLIILCQKDRKEIKLKKDLKMQSFLLQQ